MRNKTLASHLCYIFIGVALLPGTLVVEIHRQVVDFTKSQNEQELATIESLVRCYAFQGPLFEENL